MTKQNPNDTRHVSKPLVPGVITQDDVTRAMLQLLDAVILLQKQSADLAEATGRVSGRIPDDVPQPTPSRGN